MRTKSDSLIVHLLYSIDHAHADYLDRYLFASAPNFSTTASRGPDRAALSIAQSLMKAFEGKQVALDHLHAPHRDRLKGFIESTSRLT